MGKPPGDHEWVMLFTGDPTTPDTERIQSYDGEPGHVLLVERTGGKGLVDLYVRVEIDLLRRVVEYNWRRTDTPEGVVKNLPDAL